MSCTCFSFQSDDYFLCFMTLKSLSPLSSREFRENNITEATSVFSKCMNYLSRQGERDRSLTSSLIALKNSCVCGDWITMCIFCTDAQSPSFLFSPPQCPLFPLDK